jgi:probable HAF family extracellular repeat protein
VPGHYAVMLLLLVLGSFYARGERIYDVVDLGTLGGTWSAALGVNDGGVVVGESQDAAGRTHAFIWSNGVMTQLLAQPWITNSSAAAINNAGAVVGTANTASGMLQGFILSGGVFTNLGVLPGGQYSEARAINASGQVAGHSTTTNLSGLHPHAFRWTGGALADLGTLDGASLYSSEAYAIDNAGRVVGVAFYFCPFNCWDPFIWIDVNTNGAREFSEMVALDGLSGAYARARAINELGQVVGEATTVGYGNFHAFLVTPQNGSWNTDSDYNTPNPYMTDLGTLGGSNSYAWDINDAGMIVGASETTGGVTHAWLYEGGVMQDLNGQIDTNEGWTLSVARGINSSGLVAGYGVVTGQARAFLLVPASNRVWLSGARVDVESEEGGGPATLSLFWGARGSNLGFTVEAAGGSGAAWSAVEPTNQWPTRSLFWSQQGQETVPAFLRVRGESM